MKDVAKEYIDQLEIKCTSEKQLVRNLSGGNQQKVCLAKAFAMNPKLLFVSEPTRGIDVGAKQLVLDSLRKYNQENGTTIVVISSELEELRSISDRIAIISEGEIFGILPPETDITEFGLLMSGEYKINEEGEKVWLR
jgi:simple sugar transport system ATP-binding protein